MSYFFASIIGGVSILIHMFLGSALATMSIISPPMVQYAVSAGFSPLVPALLIYTSVAIHYLLPFQHVVILLGQGETGGYSTKDILRFGIPQTILTLIILVPVEITWWSLIGLL